jgi:hypothetical protein
LGCGKLRANLAGLGCAEFGEQREGLLPVTEGSAGVAIDAARPAEPAVGTGLLVPVPALCSQSECDGVFGMGVAGLAGGEQHLAEAVQRVGFTPPVPRFPVQCQRLL